MEKHNKIINKYLLPYSIGTVAFIVLGTMTGIIIDKMHAENKEIIKYDHQQSADAAPYFLAGFVILTCICMIGFSTIYMPRKAHQFAGNITVKYLAELMRTNPKLQKYSAILQNKNAIQNIANFICNNLTESEQKEILRIAKSLDSDDINNETDYVKQVQNAIQKITYVVKKHSKNNPDFSKELLTAINNSYKTYSIPTFQNVR